MKRLGNIYNKIISMDNLYEAHKNARRGKTYYKDVIMVDSNPEFYLNKIHELLKSSTYRVSDYKIKSIKDKKKDREVHILPYYPDRIIQWAIMLNIRERIESSFILDTYASIPNRGIHFGLSRMRKSISANRPEYFLKLDITKFYPSIDQDIMMDKVKRLIKCDKTLKLIQLIVSSVPSGVPIGNYLSQYLGNLYLSEIDHYCKNDLSCSMYYRYMDDIVILDNSKDRLWCILDKIRLRTKELKLSIKDNYTVSRVDEGIDFMGYRNYGNRVILRKSIYKGLCTRNSNNVFSYYGWLKHTTCSTLTNKVIKEVFNDRDI